MVETDKHHMSGSWDTSLNMMKNGVVMPQRLDCCAKDECPIWEVSPYINFFLYSFLRAVSGLNLNIKLKWTIKFEYKIKMKLWTYKFVLNQVIKTLN